MERDHNPQAKLIELLFHFQDNPNNADIACDYASWTGEDLNHCPGVGEWKCRLQRYEYASDQYGIDSIDYRACTQSDHSVCPYYTKAKQDKAKE